MTQRKKPFTHTILLFIVAAFFLFAASSSALALTKEFGQPDLIVPITSSAGSLTKTGINPGEYVKVLYTWGIGLAALLAMGQFVVGGIQYILSAGSLANKESANERMKGAGTGLAVLLSITLLLGAINPGLLNIALPTPESIRLSDGASVDDIVHADRRYTGAVTPAVDLTANNPRGVDANGNTVGITQAQAAAAETAAREGTFETAVAAERAGTGLNADTDREAEKNPFYRARKILRSQGAQNFCDDDLDDIKEEVDEYVSSNDGSDFSELVGPENFDTNGDFAEVLSEGFAAEGRMKTATDLDLADAKAEVLCKRASVLLALEYTRERLNSLSVNTFRDFAEQMILLPKEYNVRLYFKDSWKLFDNL